MYSKSSWGGPIDPFISVKFTDAGKDGGDDPVVSLLMVEWMDLDYVGVVPPGTDTKIEICDNQAVGAGHCNETDVGEFILAPNATELSNNLILTRAMHLK